MWSTRNKRNMMKFTTSKKVPWTHFSASSLLLVLPILPVLPTIRTQFSFAKSDKGSLHSEAQDSNGMATPMNSAPPPLANRPSSGIACTPTTNDFTKLSGEGCDLIDAARPVNSLHVQLKKGDGSATDLQLRLPQKMTLTRSELAQIGSDPKGLKTWKFIQGPKLKESLRKSLETAQEGKDRALSAVEMGNSQTTMASLGGGNFVAAAISSILFETDTKAIKEAEDKEKKKNSKAKKKKSSDE